MINKILKLLIITSLFINFSCSQKNTPRNNNLLLKKPKINKDSEYISKIQKIIDFYKKNKNDLKIKDQKINYFVNNNIAIRLKISGSSYQSYMGLDKSNLIFKIKKNYDILTFDIYNPEKTDLVYIIKLKTKKYKIKLFEKLINKQGFSYHKINLKKNIKNYELEFQTRGKGFGFWINPRLINNKSDKNLFIVMVLDTMRYDHTSLSGYKRDLTPNLKKLAKDSVYYKNAFSTTSWTLPAHTSLFSGKNLFEHKVVNSNSKISFDYPLLQEVFQKYGYNTVAITGGGFIEDDYGFYRGFANYQDGPGGIFNINSCDLILKNLKNLINKNLYNNFVFLHTYQIHAPYKAPHYYLNQITKNIKNNFIGITKYLNKNQLYSDIDYEKKQNLIDLYDASILYADDILIGKVIEYLKENNLYENSMIVVLSDHGEGFFEHGSWEHGNSLYSELIRIPIVIKYPKSKRTGIEERLTSISDIAYFILNEAGFKEKSLFKTDFGKENRILPILLPFPPFLNNYPSIISFVDKDYHFIYNIVNKKRLNFFNPKPKIEKYELFSLKDINEKNNLKSILNKKLNKYLKLIKKYKEILNIRGKNKIEKKLENKLKSLGYLGN